MSLRTTIRRFFAGILPLIGMSLTGALHSESSEVNMSNFSDHSFQGELSTVESFDRFWEGLLLRLKKAAESTHDLSRFEQFKCARVEDE